MRAILNSKTSLGAALASLALTVSCGGGVDAEEAPDTGDAEAEPALESELQAEPQAGFMAPPRRPAAEQPAPEDVPVAKSSEPKPSAIPTPVAPVASTGPDSMAAPAEVALEGQADAYLAAAKFPAAARAFSDLMLAAIRSGEPVDQEAMDRWKAGLDRAQDGYRWSRRADWESTTVRVRPGDSLIAIRKRVLAEHPDILLCTGLIARANELRSTTAIRADDELKVPLARPRALVDLSARWVFYFVGDEVAGAWRVGVGKAETATRPGRYTIKTKQENPPWHRPGKPMVAFGDPENPLGTRWMSWDDENGWHSTLGFHGTDDESGIGGAVSDGCIRMRNADVEVLYDILPVGSVVDVQP